MSFKEFKSLARLWKKLFPEGQEIPKNAEFQKAGNKYFQLIDKLEGELNNHPRIQINAHPLDAKNFLAYTVAVDKTKYLTLQIFADKVVAVEGIDTRKLEARSVDGAIAFLNDFIQEAFDTNPTQKPEGLDYA